MSEERLQKRPSYRAAKAAAEAEDEDMTDASAPALSRRPSARAPAAEADEHTAPARTVSLRRASSRSPSRRVSRANSLRAPVSASILLCDADGDMGDFFLDHFAAVPNSKCTVKVRVRVVTSEG